MSEQDYIKIENSLITVVSEFFRFQRVFEKMIYKLEEEDQRKYMSQFAWFSKKVYKALDESEFKILNLEGQLYDAGMAVTPLNIDEFEINDKLFVIQTVEPIIMKEDKVFKTGTVILGREEK